MLIIGKTFLKLLAHFQPNWHKSSLVKGIQVCFKEEPFYFFAREYFQYIVDHLQKH